MIIIVSYLLLHLASSIGNLKWMFFSCLETF